jgi:hypothetical protein
MYARSSGVMKAIFAGVCVSRRVVGVVVELKGRAGMSGVVHNSVLPFSLTHSSSSSAVNDYPASRDRARVNHVLDAPRDSDGNRR